MSSQNPIAIPPELREVRSSALEGYVRDRLVQFATAFSEHCMPSVTPEVLQKAIHETIAKLPPPDSGHLPVDRRELQLVFRHDCQALGCSDAQCSLCQHNPHRRCLVNFDRKYLVGDVLKAKCSANIRCEVVDRSTGVLFEDDIPDLKLEMCILDGNLYDQRCLDGGSDTEEDLRACTLLENNKKTPLLVGLGVVNDDKNAVVMSLLRGKAQLPDLHVTDSSEALLSGRKPPFRLLVRAVGPNGPIRNIRYAISEGFVVATRRTRTAGKADIPLVDDHVSKLEHMGKETVKKLQNIPEAAQQLGIELGPLPVDMVEKVGEFKTLAAFAESDGHLRQKLQQVLKLSKEKWDEARVHAMKAVVPDNRMRVWYASPTQRQIGLLFLCKQGAPQLDRVVGMVQSVVGEKSQAKLLVTMLAQLNPDQREMLRNLSPNAVQQWWHTGHTGWSIFPYDSNTYSQTGTLGPYVTLTDPPAGNTAASIPGGGGGAATTPSTGASPVPAWNSTAPAAAAPAAAAAASADPHLKKLGHPPAAAGGMPEGRPGARPAMALPHMGGAVVPPPAGSRGSSAVGSGSAPLGTPFDAGDSSHPFAGLPSGSGLSLDMDMGAPVGGGGTKRRADNSLRLGSIFSGQLPSMSLPGQHSLLDPLQSAGEGPESRGGTAMRAPQGAGAEGLGPSMASTAAALNDLPLTMMNSHDIESEMGLAMGAGAPMMSGRGVPGAGAGERPGHAMGSMVGQYNVPAPHKMEGLFPVAAGDGMAISRGPSTGLDTMMSMERSLPEVDGDATRMMDQAVKNVSGSTYVQHETGALV